MGLPAIVYTERFRLWLHIGQIFLLIMAAILTIVRLNTKGVIPSRAQIMIIVFAIKSIIFIAYQLATHYSSRFIRFASLKANFVLNAIDVVFWLTAFILTVMGFSSGGVGVLVVLLFVVLAIMVSMGLAAWVCWKDWRVVKNGGSGRVIPETGGGQSKVYGEQNV